MKKEDAILNDILMIKWSRFDDCDCFRKNGGFYKTKKTLRLASWPNTGAFIFIQEQLHLSQAIVEISHTCYRWTIQPGYLRTGSL